MSANEFGGHKRSVHGRGSLGDSTAHCCKGTGSWCDALFMGPECVKGQGHRSERGLQPPHGSPCCPTVIQGDSPSEPHTQGDDGNCGLSGGCRGISKGAAPSSDIRCPFPVGLREGNTLSTTSSQLLISELALHFTKKENLTEKPISGRWRCPSWKQSGGKGVEGGDCACYPEQRPAPWPTAFQMCP